MALYYNLTMRGTIGALNWAVVTHWRNMTVDGPTDEREICAGLCDAGYDAFNTHWKNILHTSVQLTKLVAEAYDEPLGFYEMAAAIPGINPGDLCPPFVAMGFRQFRTNADFRASTHRLPGVIETNNVNGSFVYDTNVTAPFVTNVTKFFYEDQEGDGLEPLSEFTFRPVLIRTQFTTVTHDPETKTVTYLNPHEISDVGGAAFYGITSQVSRKYILPS